MNIVMQIEGVVRSEPTDGLIPLGSSLYNALASQHSVYLITSDTDLDGTTRWLHMHNLYRHMRLVPVRKHADWRDDTRAVLDAVGAISGTGTHVDLVIHPDPAISAALLEAGYAVAPLVQPHFAKPEWRPDYRATPRPWDLLAEEAEHQALAHAADTRRTADPL